MHLQMYMYIQMYMYKTSFSPVDYEFEICFLLSRPAFFFKFSFFGET